MAEGGNTPEELSLGADQPANNSQEPKKISRRKVLGLGASVAVVGAAIGTGIIRHEQTGWPEQFNDNVQLDPTLGEYLAPIEDYTPAFRLVEANTRYEDVLTDKRYLEWLFKNLRDQTSEYPNTTSALQEGLRVAKGPVGDPHAYGTLLQLDEGGLYLTARHMVKDNVLQYVDDPYTNEAVKVTAALEHPNADIALVVAPTGLEPKPLPNVHFAPNTPKLSQRLQIVGLEPINGNVNQLYQYMKTGKLTDITDDKMKIEGLIPLGGTSGSPITDEAGRIVGVLSGFYPRYSEGPNAISNYAGAIVVPLPLVENLSQMRKIA